MDVRRIAEVEPEVEHNGTVPVWYLVHPREMKDLTDGGYLELINEFEVAAGGAVFPHSHPTHEWYFVMSGRGVMTVGDEDRDVAPGDLVYIPPDVVHSLAPTGGGGAPSTASASPWPSRAPPRSTTTRTEVTAGAGARVVPVGPIRK